MPLARFVSPLSARAHPLHFPVSGPSTHSLETPPGLFRTQGSYLSGSVGQSEALPSSQTSGAVSTESRRNPQVSLMPLSFTLESKVFRSMITYGNLNVTQQGA